MKHDTQDFERTTMPATIGRDEKRAGGRTPTRKTPVDVRGHHVGIEAHHREYVRERLGRRLAKFAPSIERIHVYFEDHNGPKGGNAYEARVHVVISGIQDVVVKEVAADPISAFDVAADRTEIALKHHFDKSWHEPVNQARRLEEQRRGEVEFILEGADAAGLEDEGGGERS